MGIYFAKATERLVKRADESENNNNDSLWFYSNCIFLSTESIFWL